jgi:hypothetical protein
MSDDTCTATVIRNEHDPLGGYRTESCQTKQPLEIVMTCPDGCCDIFQCPDCGRTVRMTSPDEPRAGGHA